jgi:hypothetical protein
MRDVNGEPMDNPKLALMEAVCISFFTIEFLLRYHFSSLMWSFYLRKPLVLKGSSFSNRYRYLMLC